MDREHLERQAVALFTVAALVEAIVCGSVIVSGWFAGVMEDHAERVFWAGAILGAVGIRMLGAAAAAESQHATRPHSEGPRDDASRGPSLTQWVSRTFRRGRSNR